MGSATRSSHLGSRNILDAIVANANSSSAAAKRRSLLSTPASTNRRRQSQSSQQLHPPSSQGSQQTPRPQQQQVPSLQLQLQSQIPIQTQQTPSQNTPTLQTLHVDQRPLRDKNYQTLIQQEIYDFLVTNKFELEMNHTITLKTLRLPTQKDFVTIFKFLYNKIDPYYQFMRSNELEIFSLLKSLNYPYLDSINRSQIGAVGAQNWPSFLGILYWLIKLNLSIVNFDIDDSLISPGDEFDRIFIKYIRDSYQAFINERDDYSDFYNEMKLQFEKLNTNLNNDISSLDEENQRLRAQYEDINNQLLELQQAEKKSLALEEDLVKFKAYIETMESRKSKWAEIIDKINDEIKNGETELADFNTMKDQYETKILSQGITINDINNLNIERDKLSKSIDMTTDRLEDTRAKVADREIELVKNHQSLENFVKQYNNLIQKIKSPSYDFEIKLNESILTVSTESNINSEVSFKSDQIIDKILKDEKIELLKYRASINSKVHQYQDEQIKVQEQYDLINEKILEQQEYLDELGSKLTASKMNYDEIYETMINDSTTYSTQIEKLERELRAIKINTNQGFIELENQYQNTLIEHEEITHNISRARKELYDKCCKMSQFIASFKFHIQTNLLELDDLTTIELDNEKESLRKEEHENHKEVDVDRDDIDENDSNPAE